MYDKMYDIGGDSLLLVSVKLAYNVLSNFHQPLNSKLRNPTVTLIISELIINDLTILVYRIATTRLIDNQ